MKKRYLSILFTPAFFMLSSVNFKLNPQATIDSTIVDSVNIETERIMVVDTLDRNIMQDNRNKADQSKQEQIIIQQQFEIIELMKKAN